MTPAELDAIEKRALAATPGEIDVHRFDEDGGYISYQLQTDAGCVLGQTSDHDDSPRAKQDAHLFANARRDVLALLAEVRRYHAAVEKLRALAGDAATQDFECSCDGYDNDGCRHQGAALALEKACRLFGEVTP